MAIKFSQFNLRTDHTSGMYLVGYDGNQNIHITVDNLFDDFINGTENTIAMFGTDGNVLVDSILSQNVGATSLTVTGAMTVTSDATFSTNIEVEGTADFNGNVNLGDETADLITQTGTLYLNGPVKDTTDTLGDTDKILVSDAAGELTFQKLSETHVKSSELIVQSIKANEALTKGDPVYIVGFQVGQGVNIVAKADASNPAKMPATGIIDEDYSAQAFGTMTAFGSFNTNFDASGGSENWSIGDILFVKSGGGLTNIKPTGSDLIQNVAIVSRNHQQTGELEVVALGRTNDIPNLTPGRLWVGSTGNTIESQTLFVDEANTEVGIGTNDPYVELHVKNTADNPGLMIESEQVTGGNFQNSYINLRAVQSSNNTLANATITLHGLNSINGAGAKTLVIKNQTLGGADVLISTLDSNSSAKNPARFKSSGQVQFEEYGKAPPNFPGTVHKNLSIDSSGNVIESAASVGGTGTLNYVTKFTPDGNTIGNSQIFDNGTNVGIGTILPSTKLEVSGDVMAQRYYGAGSTTYYVDPNDNTQAAYFAGDIRITDSSRATIKLDSTSIYPSGSIIATKNGLESPAMGEFKWEESPGFQGGQWQARTSSAPYTESSIELPTTTSYDFKIKLLGSDRMTIDSGTGRVGIGTTSPSHPLHVVGGAFDTYAGNFDGGLRVKDESALLTVEDTNTSTSTFATVELKGRGAMGNASAYLRGSHDGKLSIARDTVASTTSFVDTTLGNLISSNNTSNGNDSVFEATATSGGPSTDAVTLLFKANTDSQTGPYNEVGIEVDRMDGWPFSSTKRGKMRLQTGGNDQITMQTTVSEFSTTSSTTFHEFCAFEGLSTGVGFFGGNSATFTGKVGIGTNTPTSKLDVNGGIRMADDTATAASTNVGTLRYRTSGNNSYVDMCMQTGASTYAWVNIVQNTW